MTGPQHISAFVAQPLPFYNASAASARCRCTLSRRGAQADAGASVAKTRRDFLRSLGASLLVGCIPAQSARSEDEPNNAPKDDKVCKECRGSGSVPCELCKGSGFWNAFMGSDAKLSYKGVECPQCDGMGQITCSICLGTGEGNVRGLLRRRTIAPGKGRVLQS